MLPVKEPQLEWLETVACASSRWSLEQPRLSVPRGVGGTPKNRWTPREDFVLSVAVLRFGTANWRDVSLCVPGRSPKQCRERWLGHFSPGIVRDDWTPAEDLVLVEKQSRVGNQWAKIKEFLPGRSIVAVKNRWQWLCRRNIPSHSIEFGAMVREHGRKQGALGDQAEFPWADEDPDLQIHFGSDSDIAAFEF